MNIVHALDDRHVEELHQLCRQEWWTNDRTLEQTRDCVRHSQLCVAMLDEREVLIGFARVITDFTIKALVLDVMVRSDHRRGGLGDRLMEAVLRHERLRQVRHFELYCLPPMQAFYARHGFTTEVGGTRFMRFFNT